MCVRVRLCLALVLQDSPVPYQDLVTTLSPILATDENVYLLVTGKNLGLVDYHSNSAYVSPISLDQLSFEPLTKPFIA